MNTVNIDIAGLLDRLSDTEWAYHPPVTQQQLWAIVTQLKAFRALPRHAGSCSNQNVLDPIGAWRNVEECGCRKP